VKGFVTYNGTELSDSCADSVYAEEYYCADNLPALKAIACSSGTECLDGACIPKAANATTQKCREGPVGTVTFDNKTYSGVCQGAFDILGYFCVNDSLVQKAMNCGKGNKCQEGACVELVRTCTDSHTDKAKTGTVTVYGGGQAIDTKTDSCKDNSTKTLYSCGNASIVSADIACSQGMVCYKGACVEPCTEYKSDKGPSSASTPSSTMTDSCANGSVLTHYSCSEGEIASSSVICDYCSKGRCLSASDLTCQRTNSGMTVQLKYGGDVIVERNDTCDDPITKRDYTCISGRMEYETTDCTSKQYCNQGSCVDITKSSCVLVLPSQNKSDIHTKSWVVVTNNRSILDIHMDYCINEATLGKFNCTEAGPFMDTFNCPVDERCQDGACVYPYTCVESRPGNQYGTGSVTLFDGAKSVRTEEDTCTGDASKRVVSCDSSGKLQYTLINCQAGDTCDSTDGSCR
jgi:hypothetical protein